MVAETRPGYAVSPRGRLATSPSHQAYQLLHIAFVVAPVIAGLDKFLYVLTDWGKYLSPQFAALSPLSVTSTMYVVGVVEVIAGLLVAFKPKIGGWVVAGWLGGIILNLVLLGAYWDVALRDVGLMIGAIALARLAVAHETPSDLTNRPVRSR